jgi:membrane fusion protein, multidrug efflux system
VVRRAGALPAALALLLATGCGREEEPADPAYPQVETVVVRPTLFEEWIETTGTVEARSDAILTAEVGATVVSIASEGQRVASGQVVAQLDAGQTAAAVQQAAAAAAEARAGVLQADESFARQQPLVADTIISPLEFDQVRAQRTQARAQLEQALAVQREAEQRLEQTRLRAPFAGVVERRWVRAGEQVTPGQEVVRIVGPGAMEVVAGIPERFAGEIERGSPALVRLQAYGLGELASSVGFVGNAIHPQNRTFPIRIDLADGSGQVKADMIARVRVRRRALEGALVLPREAFLRGDPEDALLVVEPLDTLGLVRRRAVAVGPGSEQGVVVESGLRPGDEVVVLGQDEVVASDTVRVVRRYPGIEAYRAAAPSGTRNP